MSAVIDSPQTPSPGRRSRRRSGRPLRLLVLLVVVLGLLGGALVGVRSLLPSRSETPDYPGQGTGEAVVQVQPGEGAGAVGERLAAADVVKSRAAFVEAALKNPKSKTLQPGFYKLRKQMSAQAALALLLDPAARLRGRVTIPEGTTAQQALELIAEGTEIPLAQLKAAARNPAALGVPAYAKGKLEGFLFPATYDFDPGTTAQQALKQMVERYLQEAEQLDLATRAKALGRTPYEILVVASLIERESRVDEELPKVSRVIYNRLQKRMRLEVDAATLYGLGRTSGALRQSELDRVTPYNLRKVAGLPPTPISNPGSAALQAALEPAEGDWLFYVLADREGNHLFTSDYDEFLNQKNKSRREGLT